MTHEYTLLVGGVIIPGDDEPDASAIAWAGGTVIAIGTDAAVRAISRGDSHVIDLRGASVVPLAPGSDAVRPPGARLEVGGPADLAVLDRDPRGTPFRAPSEASGAAPVLALAVFRGGRLVAGALPGLSWSGDDEA